MARIAARAESRAAERAGQVPEGPRSMEGQQEQAAAAPKKPVFMTKAQREKEAPVCAARAPHRERRGTALAEDSSKWTAVDEPIAADHRRPAHAALSCARLLYAACGRISVAYGSSPVCHGDLTSTHSPILRPHSGWHASPRSAPMR